MIRPDGAWSRCAYDSWPRRLLRKAAGLKPAIWEAESPNGPVIVKDCASLPRCARTIARRLLRRECRVLEHLAPLAGVPQVRGWIDRDACVQERMPGQPLRAGNTPGGVRSVADKVRDLLREIHARDVVHLDLHHKQNVIVDGDGRVSVIDFGAALRLGRVARSLLGPLLRAIDEQGALKYVARWTPEALSPAEARSVVRARGWRRLWFFSRHAPPATEMAPVRSRARADEDATPAIAKEKPR